MLSIKILIIRPKKLIICFSGTARVTFNPPASKIFIAFSVFTLKNRLYIGNCQFRSAVICRHFVCWLAGAHTKSRKFSGNYSDTSFFSISLKKIKIKSRPPASFSKKKCLRNILLIFFGLN